MQAAVLHRALKDAAAARVTVLVPYLCYARKDRKTKARDPLTLRYVASLFEAVGADGVVAVDVHNLPAFQNAFRCRTEHLEARMLFAAYFAAALQQQEVVVVAPDAGGVKRAELFRQALGQVLNHTVPLAFMEKQRSLDVVSGEALVGAVDGRAVIILDALISTGTTLARAARACRRQGATPGTLFLSFHFPETHANRLTGPHLDPDSRGLQYKATAVRLGLSRGPQQGGGACQGEHGGRAVGDSPTGCLR